MSPGLSNQSSPDPRAKVHLNFVCNLARTFRSVLFRGTIPPLFFRGAEQEGIAIHSVE